MSWVSPGRQQETGNQIYTSGSRTGWEHGTVGQSVHATPQLSQPDAKAEIKPIRDMHCSSAISTAKFIPKQAARLYLPPGETVPGMCQQTCFHWPRRKESTCHPHEEMNSLRRHIQVDAKAKTFYPYMLCYNMFQMRIFTKSSAPWGPPSGFRSPFSLSPLMIFSYLSPSSFSQT